MAQHKADPLRDLLTESRRIRPVRARGPRKGRSRRHHDHRRRRGPAVALLALSLATAVTGIVLPHGLLLAAGLAAAGVAAYLLTPPYGSDRAAPPW